MRTFLRILLVLSLIIIGSCRTQVKEDNETVGKIEDTSSVVERLLFNTEDSVKIISNYYYRIDKKNTNQPLIILIHQYKSDKEQWEPSFIDSLIYSDYKVLSYDIRNHGESGKLNTPLQELLTGNKPTIDIKTIFEWTKTTDGIDKDRIAVIGTSMGASLAVYSRFFLNAKLAIGVSGGKGTFESYTGFDDRMMSMRPVNRVDNVFYICGDNDNNYAEEEKSILYNYIKDPSGLKLYPSSMHGKSLISEFPEIHNDILIWLKIFL